MCEMFHQLQLHFLKAVILDLTDLLAWLYLVRYRPFTPQEDSWYSFLLEAESTPGP
jgi:hypothetical protein